MLRFDTFPVIYWLFCSLLCFGLIWVMVRTRASDAIALSLSFGTLLLLRLPSMAFNREINPDESQMITQGRTLAVDPVYFRSVDGTTIGPLDSYALIIPSWVGIPFTYSSARLLGLALIAFSLFFLYKATRQWFGTMPARLALLPVFFTLGLTQNADLLSYCSELVPLLLLSAGTWLYSRIDTTNKRAYSSLFLIGLLIGMVPLGKLQGTPLAATLGLFVFISIWRESVSVATKLSQLALLGFGVLTFPAAFIGMAWANGLYDDFWLFYIEGNLRYGGNTDHWQNVLHFPRHLTKGEEFGWLILFTALLLVVAIGWYITKRQRVTLSGMWAGRLGFIALSFVAAFFAVTRTGTEFVHYFFFMVGPLFLLIALAWKLILLPDENPAIRLASLLVSVLFVGMIIGKSALNYSRHVPINCYPNADQAGLLIPKPPIVQQVRKYADEGEMLVVWGWRCDYYVSAGMIQGTAENHSERCVFGSSMTPVYQRRYLNDFLRSVPPVFVDAVGNESHWITDRKTQGHEIIKPLAAFVQTHYQYMGLYNDARLYVRKDRLHNVD